MDTHVLHRFLGLFIGLSLFISACKKDNPDTNQGNSTQTPTDDRVALTNDSIFLYAKEIYYWNQNLPTYDVFNPRQYTHGSTDLEKYETNLLELVKYSGYEYIEGQGYPRFSYIEDVSGHNGSASLGIRSLTSGVNLQGKGNDIGIYHLGAYTSDGEETFKVFIKAVYPGSPAAKVGLTRGATITKIGDETIGDNWDEDVPYINRLLSEPFSIHLEGKKTNGKSYAVDLVQTSYDSNPIYKDTVLNFGGRNIGYLAFARFSDKNNSFDALDGAFNKFAERQVEDLIVDLRYNGGGYVETAQYLTNLIVPTGTTGTMFIEQYNPYMQSGKATILKNQPVRNSEGEITGTTTYGDYSYSETSNTKPFEKKGPLGGVKNVVFLVTGNTASSSELVVNSLRAVPALKIQLVGTTTYGKPVGFFPVRLEGKYDLYLASFSTKNANNQGDYFDGFKPGTDIPGTEMLYTIDGEQTDYDEVSDYDFGDKNELYLAEALRLLGVNSNSTTSTIMGVHNAKTNTSASIKLIKGIKSKDEFKGMIETRESKSK